MTQPEKSYSRGRLVQITKRRLTAERVPRGEQPVYETHLEDHDEIIGVAFEFEHDYGRRKTVDHLITVYVATRRGAGEEPEKR